MKKKIVHGLMALGLATTTAVGLKIYKDANPQLVGKCFVFNLQGMPVWLEVVSETEASYQMVASNGLQTISIEAPKKEVVRSYREKEITEVNCQTGELKDE